MKLKYCYNCGSELKGKEQFCAVCGTKIEEDQTAESDVTECYAAESDVTGKKVRRKYNSKRHTVPAVLLTLVIGLFVWIACTIYSANTVFGEKNLMNFTGNLEWTEIEMATITNGDNNYDTLGEIAFSYIRELDEVCAGNLTLESFEKLVKQEFFTDYVAELIIQYVDAIKEKDYGKATIRLKDIRDFFDDNKKSIDKIIGSGFTEDFCELLDKYKKYYQDDVEEFEELVCLETYEKEAGFVFDILSFLLNDYLAYIFAGFSMLFVILLILLKRVRSIGYIGGASAMAGSLLLTTRILLLNAVASFENSLHLGKDVEVTPLLLKSFSATGLWLTIALFAVAIVAIVVRIMINGKITESAEVN